MMVGQLLLSIYFISINQTAFTVGNLVLVLATWVLTFVWAIPLHKKIDEDDDFSLAIDRLLKINILRALVWAAILIWTIVILTI